MTQCPTCQNPFDSGKFQCSACGRISYLEKYLIMHGEPDKPKQTQPDKWDVALKQLNSLPVWKVDYDGKQVKWDELG